jgi:hypothetical protein
MPHVRMCGMDRVAPAAITLVLWGALFAGWTADAHRADARQLAPLLVADNANEVEQEVPVVEQTEPLDSPAGDLKRGNAEAQMPSGPSTREVEQPEVNTPAEPAQPPVEP